MPGNGHEDPCARISEDGVRASFAHEFSPTRSHSAQEIASFHPASESISMRTVSEIGGGWPRSAYASSRSRIAPRRLRRALARVRPWLYAPRREGTSAVHQRPCRAYTTCTALGRLWRTRERMMRSCPARPTPSNQPTHRPVLATGPQVTRGRRRLGGGGAPCQFVRGARVLWQGTHDTMQSIIGDYLGQATPRPRAESPEPERVSAAVAVRGKSRLRDARRGARGGGSSRSWRSTRTGRCRGCD